MSTFRLRRRCARYTRGVASPSDFDFWLGTWTVRFGPTGRETGRNVVTRAFGGHVVEERFDGRPGVDLVGASVSVLDPHRGRWRQTWVDDAGNYFALEGERVGGEMVLLCEHHNAPEAQAVYRMRFFDIEHDSLSWTWERSLDGGATFDELWRLAYEREAV
jgi:hypothetical protein